MTRSARILLVDDDVPIQQAVAPLLRSRGYEVDVASTGGDALKMTATHPPDLIVLDLGLPDLEGTEVLPAHSRRASTPIIVLSARGSEGDKVAALDLGADDYVTKPFSPEELLARIRVALRRVFSTDDAEVGRVTLGDLTIDYDRRRVLRGEDEIRLTPKEFELLALLAKNADRVLTHRTILKAIWGAERRRSARAPVGADGAAPQEDRARFIRAALSAERAVGRLSTGYRTGAGPVE